MSTRIMALCWPLQLPLGAKMTLVSLADMANDEGVSWPSMEHLCERVCASDRTVQTHIKALEEMGLIKRVPRYKRSTVYKVLAQACEEMSRQQASQKRSRPKTPETYPEEFSGEEFSGEISSPEESSPENSSGEDFAVLTRRFCSSDPKILQFCPEKSSGRTVNEPSKESSGNRQQGAARPRLPDVCPAARADGEDGKRKGGAKLPVKETARDLANWLIGLRLPAWLDADDWAAWVAHRRRGKVAPSIRALELNLGTLADLQRRGQNVTAVINRSIERGWTGLFEIKATAEFVRTAPASQQEAIESHNARVVAEARRKREAAARGEIPYAQMTEAQRADMAHRAAEGDQSQWGQ